MTKLLLIQGKHLLETGKLLLQRGTRQLTSTKLLPDQGKLQLQKAAIRPIQVSGSFLAPEFCPDQASRGADLLALASFRQIGACLERILACLRRVAGRIDRIGAGSYVTRAPSR